jgi:2-polyprenyl-3-methyl-5-hydroxy-6-metoxy-1,4-benzoquinol methylase
MRIMSYAITTLEREQPARVIEARLTERLITSTVAALEMYSIHIGRQLGLYQALRREPMTPGDLAEATGIDARYAREWLEQQAVAGFLTVENPEARADERRFGLGVPALAVFTQAADPDHVSPLADMVAGVGQTLDEVVSAYQTGAGVPFSSFGAAMRDGQGGINRPVFTHDLVDVWIGAIDGLGESLSRGGRIADLGCGVGWSTIALAAGLPEAEVTGWDNDAASIAAARENAANCHVNARFEVADASAVFTDGPYDLITILEALHDMPQPGAVLEAARGALASDGVVLVADEKVADRFTAPGDELERMMYGWSVTHCLPTALSDQPSAAIGTVIREPMVRDLALQAGFDSVEALDVDAGFFRLYVIR